MATYSSEHHPDLVLASVVGQRHEGIRRQAGLVAADAGDPPADSVRMGAIP
jgi:hypothetical protein